jgi:hypothetical protein
MVFLDFFLGYKWNGFRKGDGVWIGFEEFRVYSRSSKEPILLIS